MKKFLVIIFAILLTSCVPSDQQSQPQPEIIAQSIPIQTQVDVPTVIPSEAETSTSLPFTMPPTWTPVSMPANNLTSPNNLTSHACRINGAYPDLICTPGAVLAATAAQVCTPDYSQSVRDVSESTKEEVYASYGIINHLPDQYEVDHFIPLGLGGSNDISNLWPEPAEPKPGFHEKDQVENYLHDQVCNGSISLQLAQDMIRENWVKVYDAFGSTPIPTIKSQPPINPVSPTGSCCVVCKSGKACGDACISKDHKCSKPPGCACQGQ